MSSVVYTAANGSHALLNEALALYHVALLVLVGTSFPQQIFPNSTRQLAKFCGSPCQIFLIPWCPIY